MAAKGRISCIHGHAKQNRHNFLQYRGRMGARSINTTESQDSNGITASLVRFDTRIVWEYNRTTFNRFQTTEDQDVYFNQPGYPSLPIEIDIVGAEYLNPYVPSVNTTVIYSLLRYFRLNRPEMKSLENALMFISTGLVTNGLARSSFTSELQGNIKLTKIKTDTAGGASDRNQSSKEVPDANSWILGGSGIFTVSPEESKNWVKLRVDSTIQGYAYNIDGAAPKIAILFLLVYSCLALGHCFYGGISGTSFPHVSSLRDHFRLKSSRIFRHQFNLLGFRFRSHRPRNQFPTNDYVKKHVCWHHRNSYLPNSCSNSN
jgi:hypothetical protein